MISLTLYCAKHKLIALNKSKNNIHYHIWVVTFQSSLFKSYTVAWTLSERPDSLRSFNIM